MLGQESRIFPSNELHFELGQKYHRMIRGSVDKATFVVIVSEKLHSPILEVYTITGDELLAKFGAAIWGRAEVLAYPNGFK